MRTDEVRKLAQIAVAQVRGSRFTMPFLLGALILVLVATGCGSNSPDTTNAQSTTTVTKTVVVQTNPGSQSPRPRRKSQTPAAYANCGGALQALAATTSCDFANNVFYMFYEAHPENVFPVYSAATEESYEVTCTGDPIVTCTGGKGAKVRFPMSAVNAYTESDATRYANSHDLGPQLGTPQAQDTNPAPSNPTDECDQPGDVCNQEGMNVNSPYFKELCRQLYDQWQESRGDPLLEDAGNKAIQRYSQLNCDQQP